MARRTTSRLDKRREAEAAEAQGKTTTKKKATKKKAAASKTTAARRRTKVKAAARKRLLWGVFNGNMKEEARFPYHERAAAEAKLEQLRAKSPKKMFFIQPIKEEITETPEPAEADAAKEDGRK